MQPDTLLNGNISPARPQRKKWRRIAAVMVLLMLLVLGGIILIAAERMVSSLRVVKESSAAAESLLRTGDFAAADDELAKALDAMVRAHSGLDLIAFLRIVPWVGTQMRGLAYTLGAGEETIGALREALAIAVEVQSVAQEAQALVGITDSSVPYGELSVSARVALLEALHDAHPRLLMMQVKLGIARNDLARLEELHVAPQLREAVAPFSTLITELAEAVNVLAPFSAAVPELAGLGEDRQFLLLFANDTELRPAGGFLGVYGLTVTRDGEILGMATDDVYNVDNLANDAAYQAAAPAPLATYLGAPKWFFRDSNWSPDFPSAAKDGVQLFRQEVAFAGVPVPEIHGVFMFTPTFIGRLLDAIGPVTVDGQTFTSSNIADKLEYEVEIGYVEQGIPQHQRKDVIARMADVMFDRILDLPSAKWPMLFGIFNEGFAEKETALWSANTQVQATYLDAGWAGEVGMGTADDVVMVVDANLAALKTDPEVDRTIAYSIAPTSRGYEATVAVTYDHSGSFNWKTTRYRTYTRVYAPLGSTLISSSGTLRNDALQNPSGAPGEVTQIDELGLTSFGAFTSVEPGTTHTLSFTYLLPENVTTAIQSGLYELRLLKQLGAASHDLVLDLDFHRTIERAVPGEAEEAWGDDVYHMETVLDVDKVFTVRLGN